MKLSKENIITLLIVFCAVLLTLQIRSWFGKSGKPEQMIRNEERIKYLEEKRLADSVSFHKEIAWYDSLLAVEMSKDKELQIKYVPLKKAYDKIPVVVNDFGREQLRRAITDF
jgi:hypothetical protein